MVKYIPCLKNISYSYSLLNSPVWSYRGYTFPCWLLAHPLFLLFSLLHADLSTKFWRCTLRIKKQLQMYLKHCILPASYVVPATVNLFVISPPSGYTLIHALPTILVYKNNTNMILIFSQYQLILLNISCKSAVLESGYSVIICIMKLNCGIDDNKNWHDKLHTVTQQGYQLTFSSSVSSFSFSVNVHTPL